MTNPKRGTYDGRITIEAGVDDPVGRVEVLRNALSILRNQL